MQDEDVADIKPMEGCSPLAATDADNVDAIYQEALMRYPNDEAIDQAAEKGLRRKIDARLLPLLGVCYFFYVRSHSWKNTLQVASTRSQEASRRAH